MWFLRFVKGLLCEVTANKLEIAEDDKALARYFTPAGLPSIYRNELLANTQLKTAT